MNIQITENAKTNINEACQLIMNATGCTSVEAIETLTRIFENMNEAMNEKIHN